MSDEETLAPSPRDRSRTRVTPSRQPLVAVGRVASRVRSSGLSKIPASILARGKEEEQHRNTSPWGVGSDATPKGLRISECHLDDSNAGKKKFSPKGRKSTFTTSPLSNSSQQETLTDVDRSIRRRKTTNISGTVHRKSSTEGDKSENQHGPGMVKSTSKRGTRHADAPNMTDASSTVSPTAGGDLKKGKSGPFSTAFLMRGVSKLIFRGGGGDEEDKSTPSSDPQEKSSSKSGVSPVSDECENEFDAKPSPREQRSSLGLGLHRDAVKQSMRRNKNKALVTPQKQQNIAQNKSRAAVEMTKGLAKSISSVARTPLEIGKDKTRAPTFAKGNNNNDTKKSRKDNEQKPRKTRSSWFGLGRDDVHDGEKERGGGHKRGKSRVRAFSSPQKIGDASASGLTKKRSPKGLDKVVDFAVDDYFDSEEDEIEAGANVRSLAEDDFISYQTRQLKKGERGKNR
ncbi:hypothetical protein BWQ96_04057 [Gracilariopsis chorda]|uniref:Uncharacterized protein n=1 Tax=Gracilariopsis chorda TaxID=448386 RepID=A0A2V3IYH0_9FLOR|nr:hypothetical protein BWQ96_04057 [Gracilariopsis chorda]|eukprot:PXF46180.1 hypothetical protein BWQ96_04057 [Gracilariopsis chorda]